MKEGRKERREGRGERERGEEDRRREGRAEEKGRGSKFKLCFLDTHTHTHRGQSCC